MKHRSAIGGLWDEIGELQFNFLVAHGLKSDHRLLDIGCGPLRGGLHFIRYLDIGHYYGIEKEAANLAGADIELIRSNLAYRRPNLMLNSAFNFEQFGVSFDYALAQSVFTHLTLNDIIVCLTHVGRVLTPEGRFYATFFEDTRGPRNTDPITWQTADGKTLTTYPTPAKSMHYRFEYFVWAAKIANLKVNYVGDWDHPRRQRMMVFMRDVT